MRKFKIIGVWRGGGGVVKVGKRQHVGKARSNSRQGTVKFPGNQSNSETTLFVDLHKRAHLGGGGAGVVAAAARLLGILGEAFCQLWTLVTSEHVKINRESVQSVQLGSRN